MSLEVVGKKNEFEIEKAVDAPQTYMLVCVRAAPPGIAFDNMEDREMAYSGLSGRAAIVTGAAGGIGAAVVQRLLDEGCSVMAADLSADGLRRLADSLPERSLRVLSCDITVESSARRLADEAAAAFGSVDLLVSAHGVLGASGPIAELPVEDFDQVYAVNVRGVFLAMKAVLRHMIDQGRGGAIVNVASVAALRTRGERSLYGAAKRAVLALSAAAAAENGQHDIRVNAIAPGAIETEMLAQLANSVGIGRWGDNHRPIARNGTPEEVASLIAYLLSEDASYCTGAVYAIDGGLAI